MAHSDFFLDTQYPNPNQRKMGDVLCIFTYRCVLILDMDKILRDEDYKEGTSPKRAPVKRILNFLESGLLLGMGLVKFGNFLYMFGGEDPFKDPKFSIDRHEPRVYGFGIPEKEPPSPAFRLDLTNDVSEPVPLRPMLGPKLYAIVEEIGGKIYVLSQRCLSVTLPMFEVLNPLTEEWRTLPNPLPPSKGWLISAHYVSGNDIICVRGSFNYCRFSTITETWEYTKDIPSRDSREKMAMSGRFDVRHEDVYLTFWGEDDEMRAMMDWPEGKDGYSAVFDSPSIHPHVPDFVKVCHTTLINTSEQGEYMCGLLPYVKFADKEGFANDECYALYVFVFQVEKLESEKVQAALSVRYLRRQVYDLTYIESKSKQCLFFIIREAVIGRLSYNASTGSGECSRGEAKRKREEVNDEDEEGQAVTTHRLP